MVSSDRPTNSAPYFPNNGPWPSVVFISIGIIGSYLAMVLPTKPPSPPVSAVPVTPLPSAPVAAHVVPAVIAHPDTSKLFSVRQVFEQNGWNVVWDNAHQQVLCHSQTGSQATINLVTHTAVLDGKSIGTVASCVVRHGRVYGISDFLQKATGGRFQPGATKDGGLPIH